MRIVRIITMTRVGVRINLSLGVREIQMRGGGSHGAGVSGTKDIGRLLQKNLMIFLLLVDLEQDQMGDHFKPKNSETVLTKHLNLLISLLILTKRQLSKLQYQKCI